MTENNRGASPSEAATNEDATGRDFKDYAIEFGGYLATAAENYLNERNRYEMAVAGYADEGSEVPDMDSLTDHHQALRAAIYEFRKRSERARTSSSGQGSTELELDSILQRKPNGGLE